MDGADQDGSLTSVERHLVGSVENGVLLDLADGWPIDESAMRSWDGSRAVRASVIRNIVRGLLAADPDPCGIRLRGAQVTGRLDLADITSAVAVELLDCLLTDGVNVKDASLTNLTLKGCHLEQVSAPALEADRLTAAVLRLHCTTATAHTALGAVTLRGAHVGLLDCRGAHLYNDAGPALRAEHLCVTQTVDLREGFHAIGTGDGGTVRLVGAHISGQLECDGAHLRNDSGPALVADWLHVEQSVFFRNGFTATASSEMGAIRLAQALLGDLDCRGAHLRNDAGPALAADGLRVELAVFLFGAILVGAGTNGTVRLVGAHISGQLSCSDAQLHNDSGPALLADKLRVDQSVFLDRTFKARGNGKRGAISLRAAHVDSLDCRGAHLRNDAGPALQAEGLQVTREVYLHEGFKAVGSGDGVAVDLRGTRIGGALSFDPARLEHQSDRQARLRVDGLTYAGLPQKVSVTAWLDLLRDGTPDYAAQPYQHFATAHRAAGHDTEARKILMTQRRDQLDRYALTGHTARGWARLTGWLLGYGYQPGRALIWLVATIITAVILTVCLGSHGGLVQARMPATSPAPTACTLVEQIGVGLDLGTPLITTGARASCDTTNTTTGQVLTISIWTLQLFAWVFATLFIAGFTRAVRKT
ncbi:hypothetical protein [Amycolatopsis aidingensis]|uniref:hypothetical protein n=1 Tax=Amycolatopsis aidingensis TaxID=2842453 RepID=UPI001C0C916A|nr:hypothetical protein [Amycolatopsis aidingensis]